MRARAFRQDCANCRSRSKRAPPAAADASAEEQIDGLFGAGAEWLHLRHAEAGCFIARIDRA
jgi:hypothetical protein